MVSDTIRRGICSRMPVPSRPPRLGPDRPQHDVGGTSAHHTCTQAPNLTEARPWGHQCTPHVHPCPQPRTSTAGSRRGAPEQKRPHRRALPALRDPRCHPEAAHSGRTVTRGSATVEIGREDRKSVVSGKSVSVRVDLGGSGVIKKKKKKK